MLQPNIGGEVCSLEPITKSPIGPKEETKKDQKSDGVDLKDKGSSQKKS